MSHGTVPPTVTRDRDAVRLMRGADVPAVAAGRTFRYSRGHATAAAALIVGASAVLVAVGLRKGPFPAYWVAAILPLLLWMFRDTILARFEPTNWLLRMGEHGLYIKFRSYLNHHFPERDPTVVFIPYREIRSARLVRETRDVPDSDGRGTVTGRRVLVELELRHDAPELEQALAAERRAKAPAVARWYGSSSRQYRHYPVRMPSSRRVELEWGVVPGAPELLRAMGVHTAVEATDVAKDFVRLRGLKREEQEGRLLELAETGQTMAAIRLARSLYGYDLTEAKDFVDGLLGRSER